MTREELVEKTESISERIDKLATDSNAAGYDQAVLDMIESGVL